MFKELFKFFIDSQDESLAEKLMESVALDDNYQQFLESAWFKLSKVKDAHDIGLDSNGSICKQVLGDDHPYSDNSGNNSFLHSATTSNSAKTPIAFCIFQKCFI